MAEDRTQLLESRLTQPPAEKLPTWPEIKRELFAVEVGIMDEHTFKLVQVCEELDARTRSDEIGSDVEQGGAIYKRAALNSIRFPPVSVNFKKRQ